MRPAILAPLAALAVLAAQASDRYAPPDSNLYAERGKTAVGLSFLFNTDYVHAGQRGVTGMAYVVVTPEGVTHPGYTRPVDYVQSAYLHYRWRQLGIFIDAGFQPEQWKTLLLERTGEPDLFVTREELPVPDYPCDFEFRLEASLRVPYYEYVDYTGLGLGTGGYSEAPPICVTGRLQRVEAAVLPTGGTDWFIRVRPYRSAIHAMRLSY